MQSLGLDVLFKGSNFLRLLGGLWVAVRISLVSVAISIALGIPAGILMTSNRKVVKGIFRVYLEIVRIMPQMVLLFIVYFGTTRVWLEPFGGGFCHHRICLLGLRRDGGPGARRADQHSQNPI